jgi:hypothetical protein
MGQIESVTYKSNSPLAFCPVDGLFVASGAAVASGNARLRLSHVSTNCPTCNGQSEILPGLYAPDGENISLLLDPGISPAALKEIQRLLLAVQIGEITPEHAQMEAERVHPGWGKFFNIAQWSDQAKATLYASVIGAIAIVAAARINSPPSQTVIINPPTALESVTSRKSGLLGSTALNNHFLTHNPTPKQEPHHRKRR